MLLLTFISALHCFLLSLVIYSGLPFSCSFVLFSIQCLVFVFVVASSAISWLVISLLRVSRTLLRPCLLMRRLSPVRLYSSKILFVLLFHILFSFIVIDLFSEGPFFVEYSVGLHHPFLFYHPFYGEVSCFLEENTGGFVGVGTAGVLVLCSLWFGDVGVLFCSDPILLPRMWVWVWLWSPLVATQLPSLFHWILCYQFLLWCSVLLLGFSFLVLLYVQIGFLCYLSFLLGICMPLPLPVFARLGWVCCLVLFLFWLICILQLQILCGISRLYGLWCRAFVGVHPCHCG